MDFLASTKLTFQKQRDLVEGAVVQLSWDQIRTPLGEESNSIAVIMKHMAGNLISRWTDFLITDGEKPWRERDAEFDDDFIDREELNHHWERGWSCLFESLEQLSEKDLKTIVTIRDEEHSVYLAILRSLSHSSYHVGQIVQIARVLAGSSWQTLSIPKKRGRKPFSFS